MDGNVVGRQDETSPNVNCLDGKHCPKCGSYGPFEVVVTTRVLLSDEGSDYAQDGALEYDNESPARCPDCHYEGKFGDFDVR
jgi:hypothetical protein